MTSDATVSVPIGQSIAISTSTATRNASVNQLVHGRAGQPERRLLRLALLRPLPQAHLAQDDRAPRGDDAEAAMFSTISNAGRATT